MNQTILKVMASTAYWSGTDALFYYFNRSAKRVLTFHNVLPDDFYAANVANGVSCSASVFRDIVRLLKKRWCFSTDLFDLSTITITFDDGYLNQYEVAAEILREEGDIPAIVFPAGDVLDGKTLTVDKLLHWASYVPQEILRGKGYADGHQLWVKEIWPKFNADSALKGLGLYRELEGIYPFEKIMGALSSEYRRLRLTGITSTQLDDLRGRGWKVGWHTQSHYPLAQLTRSEALCEITPPPHLKCEVFSFPYGEMRSVNAAAIQLVRECGFSTAVSNTIVPDAPYGQFFLPRMAVPSERGQMHFVLSGAKHFLKFHSRLPKVSREGR